MPVHLACGSIPCEVGTLIYVWVSKDLFIDFTVTT